MNNLQKTNLILVAANLPESFTGSPQQFFTALVQRLKIMSPHGLNFIVISDSEPTSNQGPWLKGGTSWYCWDDVSKKYIPADVSDSLVELGLSVISTEGGEDYFVLSTVGGELAYRQFDPDNFIMDGTMPVAKLEPGQPGYFVVAGNGGVFANRFFNPVIDIQPSQRVPLNKIAQSSADVGMVPKWDGANWSADVPVPFDVFIPNTGDADVLVTSVSPAFQSLVFTSGTMSLVLPFEGSYKITATVGALASGGDTEFLVELFNSSTSTVVPGSIVQQSVGNAHGASLVCDCIVTTTADNQTVTVRVAKGANTLHCRASRSRISAIRLTG